MSNDTNKTPPRPMSAPSSTEPIGLIQHTSAAEGFYRRNWALGTATEAQNKHSERRCSAPVRPQAMSDRDLVMTDVVGAATTSAGIGSGTVKAGSLRPPGELGVIQTPSVAQKTKQQHQNQHHPIRAHPATVVARQHQEAAVQRGHKLEQSTKVPVVGPASIVTSFCYNGIELIVATACSESVNHDEKNEKNSNNDGDGDQCYVILARTQLVLQRLHVPEPFGSCGSIMSLQSHASSGQICVAWSNGNVQTFQPVEMDPKHVSAGSYRWIPGPVIECALAFYDASAKPSFRSDRFDLSLTSDKRVLVAHRDQLAVFDSSSKVITKGASYRAEILWATQLPGLVVSAKISGDGNSIAVVCQGDGTDCEDEDDARAATDGVHTFERDSEDGSLNILEAEPKLGDVKRSSLDRVQSRGILYKPGPFLVHSAPVNRLSFRGYGHVTSNFSEQGNDLLLTYCEKDCTARIFGQNQWHPLTEWTTPSNTRVDWVKGISAFTLGDLESVKKEGKRTSLSRVGGDSQNNIHETVGKRFHFSSIHNNPPPSTSAGAWVVEISFEDIFPALRLSRITYLRRGVDDLDPTLLESVSAFLPANCVFRDRVLSLPDCGFSVEGIWPAWNPFLSETTDLQTTETLEGSAMALLGLNSSPSAAASVSGATFGAHGAWGGAQSPPSELRIVTSHATAGQVSLLEFPLLGDKTLTFMELGQPIRYILAIAQLNRMMISSSDQFVGTIPRPSKSRVAVDYNSGRLVAEFSHRDSSRVLINWRRPGTMSFLPYNWLAEDTNPKRAETLLQNFPSNLRDESLIPVPLSLPPMLIPVDTIGCKNASISAILWWPETKVYGSLLLIAIFSNGTVAVFEIAPPWSALEPPMPDCGKPQPIVIGMAGLSPSGSTGDGSSDDFDDFEYEVAITPDLEYGLGLRLESQLDGMCAVAGSFKRHPVTGEALPAEKGGSIKLGDELLRANDIILEDKPFDDIITAVREVGTACGPGNPVRMRFRRAATLPESHGSISHHRTPSSRSTPNAASAGNSPGQTQRRTMQDMLGLKADNLGNSQSESNCARTLLSATSVITSVVGHFPNTITETRDQSMTPYAMPSVIALAYESENKSHQPRIARKALIFSLVMNSIVVTALSIPLDSGTCKAECFQLGKFEVTASLDRFCGLEGIKSATDTYIIGVCNEGGEIFLVSIVLEPTKDLTSASTVDFQSHRLFRLKKPWSVYTALRLHSSALLATLQPDDNGTCNGIIIWMSNPQPGCSLVQPDRMFADLKASEYWSSEVSSEYCVEGNHFIDFGFIRPGFLDANPSLCTFSMKGASLFQKRGENSDWVPAAQISYPSTSWTSFGKISTAFSGQSFIKMIDMPRDSFPHLLPSLVSVHSSHDELLFLRSDWHPDSLISQVCVDSRGARAALQNCLRSILIWLCSESREIPEGHVVSSLTVTPLQFLDDCILDYGQEKSLPATASFQPERESDMAGNKEAAMIRDLQSILLRCITSSTLEATVNIYTDLPKNPASFHNIEHRSSDLPAVLSSMELDDIRLLHALAELVLKPPNFGNIDVCGQLFVFAASFFQNILNVSHDTEKPRLSAMPEHLTMVRKNVNAKDLKPRTVASAGILGALISGNQYHLRCVSTTTEQKFTWTYARQLRLAFWLRSDIELARLSEEIGQCIFRESRDIMDCAIFFVVAGKLKKLHALAATDQSTSGKTFFKFLSKHDFSTEVGRRAAEKNAFSLLRKCRFQVASAFFLLAEPPFLNSALETIATKMEDIDLAFLVGRLMESPELRSATKSQVNSRGIFGGGGFGYPSTLPSIAIAENPIEDVKFFDWKPRLGKETSKLLIERILPSFAKDNGMTAVTLIWLQKTEEAVWFLSGNIEASYKGLTTYNLIDDVSSFFFDAISKLRTNNFVSNVRSRPVDKANMLVDLSSSPILLHSLRACPRVRLAASIRVSGTLLCRGLELASMRTVIQYASRKDYEAGMYDTQEEASMNGLKQKTQMYSSMGAFDSPKTREASKGIQHSIFNDFDPAPPRNPALPGAYAIANDAALIQSSIFDDFEPPKSVTSRWPSSSHSVATSSSIDKDRVASVLAPESLQSSIFDDFDVPKSNSAASGAAAMMTSSLFDEFVTQPCGKSKQSNDTQSFILPTVTESCSKSDIETERVFELALSLERLPCPSLWFEWKNEVLLDAASRRLLRETASVLSKFHGDPPEVPVAEFYSNSYRLISPGISEVLQVPCDSRNCLGRIKQILERLSTLVECEQHYIVQRAIKILGFHQHHRMLVSVVLLLSIGRGDLAEDVVRSAASTIMQKCDYFSVSNDNIFQRKQTRSHVSSQFLRREIARVSWQIESCLWLHRGGGLPLSGNALNEATVAVRVGLMLASWNRNYFCLESILRCEPDCITDKDAGRPLWTSLRAIDLSKPGQGSKKTSSGGWEFLVECRRSQATELLRERPTGCFIIRPHSEDHGVFTLSFKTNLIPVTSTHDVESGQESAKSSVDEKSDSGIVDQRRQSSQHKKVKKDDVVQHAIIRLSNSGFRCGSFGPFISLITLLEVVSSSLPFKLRFDLPPRNQVIKEEGSQTSPNAVLLRRLTLHKASSLATHPPIWKHTGTTKSDDLNSLYDLEAPLDEEIKFTCLFLELLVVSLITRQLSGVVVVIHDDTTCDDEASNRGKHSDCEGRNQFVIASRTLKPLLTWCHSMEVSAVHMLAPDSESLFPKSLASVDESFSKSSANVTESAEAIEVEPMQVERERNGGDSILRGMIQHGSGVEFSTLRLVDGGDCTMVVLFNKKDAIEWLISNGIVESKQDANSRLEKMEKERVIEGVSLSSLALKQKTFEIEGERIRYRFVDPWEVEPLQNREGETKNAALGRGRFVGFSLGQIGLLMEESLRKLDDAPLLELWASAKGVLILTKALASVFPPWERAASGDLQLNDGNITEPSPFINSIREALYRNALYRRLKLPQRFLALIQVEMLDLKNLSSPGGSLSMNAYSLLRLKRAGSSAVLTNKARTLDSAATTPVRLNKTSGPNAPASWGSVVRFRFPLPENVSVDGTSHDRDRESLFKGPPCVLQISVYEKKLLVDHSLGTADIRTDGLGAGGQLEEWVPLRSEKKGITWFARVRLTLRFELMCTAPDDCTSVPSVGFQRIESLCRSGSVHEDPAKHANQSMSQPDLISYFENIV